MWWSCDTHHKVERLCTCANKYSPQSPNNGPLVCDGTGCFGKKISMKQLP